MDKETYNEYYETTKKTIDNSNLIEKTYKNLSNIELEKGKDSKEYKYLFDFLKHSSKLEYEIINRIIDSPFCLYFYEIITNNECKRLIEKIKNDYELCEKVLLKDYSEQYDILKKETGVTYTKDDFIEYKMSKISRKILLKNIFILRQGKMYINILDYYINTIDNIEIKRILLEEKYSTITKNKNIENWYFKSGDNIDYLLVESDYIVADRLNMNLQDFLSIKGNYYNNSFELIIDNLLDNQDKNNNDELLYETNMLSILFCMNIMSLKDSYDNIEYDMEHNPELYDEKSIDLIEKVYEKYPVLEKKLRPIISNKEVI